MPFCTGADEDRKIPNLQRRQRLQTCPPCRISPCREPGQHKSQHRPSRQDAQDRLDRTPDRNGCTVLPGERASWRGKAGKAFPKQVTGIPEGLWLPGAASQGASWGALPGPAPATPASACGRAQAAACVCDAAARSSGTLPVLKLCARRLDGRDAPSTAPSRPRCRRPGGSPQAVACFRLPRERGRRRAHSGRHAARSARKALAFRLGRTVLPARARGHGPLRAPYGALCPAAAVRHEDARMFAMPGADNAFSSQMKSMMDFHI